MGWARGASHRAAAHPRRARVGTARASAGRNSAGATGRDLAERDYGAVATRIHRPPLRCVDDRRALRWRSCSSVGMDFLEDCARDSAATAVAAFHRGHRRGIVAGLSVLADDLEWHDSGLDRLPYGTCVPGGRGSKEKTAPLALADLAAERGSANAGLRLGPAR